MSHHNDAQIIVLGQGIAGLTTAIVLAQAGHMVHVIGRKFPVIGGLQLAPNGLRALAKIGLEEDVLDKAVRLNSVVVKSLSTNLHLAEIVHKSEHRHAAIARQDMIDLLTTRVRKIPAITITDADVTALHLNKAEAQVVTGDNELFGASEAIGADGANGLARATITGQCRKQTNADYLAMRAQVKGELLPPALRRPSTMLLLGDGCHLVNYPIAGGVYNNLVFCASAQNLTPGWPQRFFERNPLLYSLTDTAINWIGIPVSPADALPVWRCSHLSLVGDAAHVMPPHLAQGAGQTFVDLAHLKTELALRPLPDALSQMAIVRSREVQKIFEKASVSGRVMRLSGLANRARNTFLGMTSPRFLPAWLNEVWETEI